MPDMKKKSFQFGSDEEPYTVEVWCEGRDRDPSTESYHPMYAYRIVTPDWEYVDNDIRGGANELPDLSSAAKSLFAFLYACQEGYPEDMNAERENARLFPPHVREWAYMVNDELSAVYEQLSREENGKKSS